MNTPALKSRKAHLLSLDIYRHDNIYAREDQIADQNRSSRASNEANSTALAKSFCKYKYEYARGMINLYLYTPAKSGDATDTNAVQNVDGKNKRTDEYIMVLI